MSGHQNIFSSVGYGMPIHCVHKMPIPMQRMQSLHISTDTTQRDLSISNDHIFSNRYQNMYNIMDRKASGNKKTEKPNLLNFNVNTPKQVPQPDTGAGKRTNDRYVPPEKRCGIKTLLNTKSKMTYPFERVEQQNETSKKKSDDFITIPIVFENESAPTTNTNDETNEVVVIDIPEVNNIAIDVVEVVLRDEPECDPFVAIDVAEAVLSEDEPNIAIAVAEAVLKEDKTANLVLKEEGRKEEVSTELPQRQKLSGSLSRFNNNAKYYSPSARPRFDIKNAPLSIVNMDDVNEHKSEIPKAIAQELTPKYVIDSNGITGTSPLSSSPSSNNNNAPGLEAPVNYVWPRLTVDMIGISFKVIADLPIGAKLKIVDDTHFAEDNSFMIGFSRYSSGQNRAKIVSFLEHLYQETERNINDIVANIRTGTDKDTSSSVVRGLIYKTDVFLHRFENMRNVYKTDSSTFARLGIIRDKFYTFLEAFFRDMLIPK